MLSPLRAEPVPAPRAVLRERPDWHGAALSGIAGVADVGRQTGVAMNRWTIIGTTTEGNDDGIADRTLA